MTTTYLKKALAGELPSAEDWNEHIRRFHEAFPGLTPAMFRPFLAAGARSSYEVLADAVAESKPASVLDVGCGDGTLLKALRDRLADAKLYGIDLSEAELALARKKPGLSGAWFQTSDARELEFAPSSIDAVVAHLSLATIVDIDRVASEIHRVLVPGGRFVFAVENPAALSGRNAIMVAAVAALREAYPRFIMPSAGVRVFTLDGISAVLQPPGFRNIACEDVELTARLSFDTAWAFVEQTYVFALLERGILDALRDRVVQKVPVETATVVFPLRLVSAQR